MTQKKQIFKIIVISILLFIPTFAFARGLVPCGGYKADGTPESPCTVSDIFVLIARVTNWLIMMAGVYAVYVIVGAGFWLIVSSGEEEKITARKKQLSEAVVGFVIVMMAFMMVNTAVNALLINEDKSCKIDLRDPLLYLTIDPDNPPAKCTQHK